MTEYSLEDALELHLVDDAINNAIEAATEANVAGLEPQEQLVHAVKAYIFSLLTTGWRISGPGTVNLPTSVTEAEAMQKLGYAYLRTHDPKREI